MQEFKAGDIVSYKSKLYFYHSESIVMNASVLYEIDSGNVLHEAYGRLIRVPHITSSFIFRTSDINYITDKLENLTKLERILYEIEDNASIK